MWLKTHEEKYTVLPCIVVDGLVVRNPAYENARYELQFVCDKNPS